MTAIFTPRRPNQYRTPLGLFLSDSFFMLVIFLTSFLSLSDNHRQLLMYIMCFVHVRRLKMPVTELQSQSGVHEG